MTAAWGQPRPIDVVYAWLCRRAEAGKRMLSDKDIAVRTGVGTGSAVGHHIQRLKKWRRIEIHVTGVGNNVQRKVQITATGHCTAYSRRKPRTAPPERYLPREIAPPATLETAMRGRRFDDVPLRPRLVVPRPAPRPELPGARSSLG